MKTKSLFAVGGALVLSAKLGHTQPAAPPTPAVTPTTPSSPPSKVTEPETKTEAPPPPATNAPHVAKSALVAKPAPQMPAPAAPVSAKKGVQPPGTKARAAQVQAARIQVLDENIEKQQRVAKQPAATAGTPTEAESTAKEAAEAAIASDTAKRDAAQTALAVLAGEEVPPEQASSALEVEKKELARLKAEGAAPAEVEASETTVEALSKATKKPGQNPPADKTVQQFEFENEDRLHFGPTISLLRVSALRDPGEPGRFRNYEGRYEFVPAEFGFQFLFAPHNRPWRYQLASGSQFQLLSAGGMLLARIDKDDVKRGNLSIAATLNFFQEIIGLGVGVDLYRGVPVQGADGRSGSETAFTGLLAWSLMRRGEVTPENVFFVVTLGLEPLVRSVTGEL